jgi:putative phosphoribosyl transferase
VARAAGAARIVLATPVAPPDWTTRLAGCADEFVSVETPAPFWAVGQFYVDFAQTTDDEVVELLAAQVTDPPSAPPPDAPTPRDDDATIPAGTVTLDGRLTVPDQATGVVVFVHGSGSSRHSPRNRYVAEVLNAAGLATLLFDLLTPAEEHRRHNVFDVELLAGRLMTVTAWLRCQREVAGLAVGYFGASTGAAAALVAETRGAPARAIVSRGGRPDLAGDSLPAVWAPTLLIVGGDDTVVLGLNREARSRLRCASELTVIPGATHLFEEPGTLHEAAIAARDWFVTHLRGADAEARQRSSRPRGTGTPTQTG